MNKANCVSQSNQLMCSIELASGSCFLYTPPIAVIDLNTAKPAAVAHALSHMNLAKARLSQAEEEGQTLMDQ